MSDAKATTSTAEAGEAQAAPPSADERPAPASASSEKELLCTICGLRACWTEAGPPKSPSS